MKPHRIGDVLEMHRSAVEIDPMALYQSIGVRSFGRGLFRYPPTSGAELSKLRFFTLASDCLVISNIKAWEGAVAVSTQTDVGCIASNRFLQYQPIGTEANINYLKYLLLSEAGLRLLGAASPGSADRNRTLAQERFENLRVMLPEIEDQRRIAARLDQLFEQLDHVGALRERCRAVVAATSPALAHRHDLSDAEKTKKGWQRVPLQQVITPSRDPVEVVPGEHYPNVGILNFGRGLFEKPSIDSLDTRATTLFRIRSGQFIYSRLFAFEGAYTVVPDAFDGYFVSNEFPTFDLDRDAVAPDYLRAYFRAPHVWDELAAGSKGLGVRRRRVHPDRLLEHVIWVPPIGEQQRIGRLARELNSANELAVGTDARVKALRYSILNRAFADAA